MKTTSESLASLRIAAFRRLWGAIMVFNIGHLVLVVASSWLILEMTGSPLWVSAMVGAPTLPLLLFALPAGAAADLFGRQRILTLSAATMALAATGMATATFSDVGSPGLLVALGGVLGIGVAFFNPAWQAIVPALVPQHLVPGAISLNSASGGAATAIGPAVGGALVATVGPAWSFVVAAAGYAVMVGSSLVTRQDKGSTETDTMATAIAGGIRYIRFSRGYLILLLLGSCFGFTSAALRAMLPNLTSDVLGGDAGLYGLLLGVFGVGAVVGGLTRHLGSRLLGRGMIPLSIVIFGLAGIGVASTPELWAVSIAIGVSGLMWTWILATLNSIFQMLTPDWVRGRTMAAFVLAVFGILPIGAVAAGALGDVLGADTSLLVFSGGVVTLGLFSLRLALPVLEEIDPPVMVVGDEGPVGSSSIEGPVMVVSTWTVRSDEELDDLASVFSELRRLRLATGAIRWNAYRSTSRPLKMTETYVVPSWDHHMQLEARLDTRGREVLDQAMRLGMPGRFVTSHLIELDMTSNRPAGPWTDGGSRGSD